MARKDERQSGVDYRIRFFTHKGKEILLVDLSNCTPAEVEQISRKVPDYVTTKPPKSVLLLADFAGASLDQNAVWTMKESAVFDCCRPQGIPRNRHDTPTKREDDSMADTPNVPTGGLDDHPQRG